MVVNEVSLFSVATPPSSSEKRTAWASDGQTVAGAHGAGPGETKLEKCTGLCVDTNGSIIIADFGNHRIVEWKPGATKGQVIAGGNGPGDRLDQLNHPSDVIVDENGSTLYICDSDNRRVIVWPREPAKHGKILIRDISCYGLALDKTHFFYVTDKKTHAVRQYSLGQKGERGKGKLVAGGNSAGDGFNQLNHPTFVFVDHHNSIYISDTNNHRVMKWLDGATEGIVVAGSGTKGNDRTQLDQPSGLFVDKDGAIYVADSNNNRIMRWHEGMSDVIVGESKGGSGRNQLLRPEGLAFDRQETLYVADMNNHRIQQFSELIA